MEKISPKILLGLDNIPNVQEEEGEDTYSYVAISGGTEKYSLRLAQPGVVNTKSLRTREVVGVLFPFPKKEGCWPRNCVNIKREHITEMDSTNPFKQYEIATMEAFGRKSIDALIGGARKYGIMSFFLNQKTGVRFLDKIDQLKNRFKYHTVFSTNKRNHYDVLYVREDIVQPVITVFDMRLCIPVFNHKRCDGVGLNYELILAKSTNYKSRLASFGCLSMLFSNFSDNLFYIDGVRILDPIYINEDVVETFKRYTNITIGSKKEKEKKKEEDYMRCSSTTSSSIDYTSIIKYGIFQVRR